VKAVHFVGTARKDLAAFPEPARRRAGHVQDEAGAFRVIYVAKFEHAVYVLHAFQKKSKKTLQADIDLGAMRYQLIREGS
jgi:phage-related protein